MNKTFVIDPIKYNKPFREVLKDDFKSIPELPISGGWGYTIDEAIIIDKHDPIVSTVLPFDGVGIEYAIVEKRLFEELIIFRPKGEKWGHIKWILKEQKTHTKNEKIYDYLVFSVKAHSPTDYLILEDEIKNGLTNDSFDILAYEERFEKLFCHTTTEYWFDITSFYK
jgi:hypothetical protein